MDQTAQQELESFIADWRDTPEQNRKAFMRLRDRLAEMVGVLLDFKPRPGVTYSLRASHQNQKTRELFSMVDVIEDDPRWLSVCFYGDMITDPEEKGDFVPEGLLGQDAVCFDLEEWDEDLLRYIEARLDEAARHAAEG